MTNVGFTLHDGIMAWFEGPEWDDVVLRVFKEQEGDLETWARSNAVWQDDTGAARAGITARAVNQDGIIVMTLYHTVPHGYWLETIQNGRFAILMRTLEENSRKLMKEATEAVKVARKGKS